MLVLCVACHDDRTPHVYHAPAPAPSAIPAIPVAPSLPEIAFGSTAADARITSVADAATGFPVPLTNLPDSVVIMTMVARGPAWTATEPLEVQLVLQGACDGVMAARFPAPAPVVIAHQFRLSADRIAAMCARGGESKAHVTLVGSKGRLASSVPLDVALARPR